MSASEATASAARKPSAVDDFLFDLNGYLILKNAVDAALLGRLNDAFDRLPELENGEWAGNAQRRDYNKYTGYELHHAVEAGGAFEELIDHPAWIEYMRRYCGESGTYVEGLFIDESIASVRRSGGHHPVHSGGYHKALRGVYAYDNGVFRCGQCNIILAVTKVGAGDGATMIVPGSHKSNLPHPMAGGGARGEAMDALPGAVPLYLEAGDALLFVDAVLHGGSARTNTTGERRVTIYRYGPSWGTTRYGYRYSRELLARLTPERRKILEPIAPLEPE